MDSRIIKAIEIHKLSIYEFMFLHQVADGNFYSKSDLTTEVESHLITSLKEKGYLTRHEELSQKARSLFHMITMLKEVPEDREIDNVDRKSFSTWWENYPKTDGFGPYLPKKGLRLDPTNCFKLYMDVVEEGYSHEDLLKALKREVNIKKQNSTYRNEMTYMPNSLNYLTKRAFLPWLEGTEDSHPNVTVNVQVYGNLK